MGLPTCARDLPYPAGDGWAIRSAASRVRATLPSLGTARRAAVHVDEIARGDHWRGEAFDVFRAAIDRKPLPAAIDHARDRMERAADELDRFAHRFERNTETIRWCRHRIRSLGLENGEIPDELISEVQRIARDAERAYGDHRAALRSVADTFDWLDDEPTFASPPPSTFDRVRGVAGHVVQFGIGIGEGVIELAESVAMIALYINPVTGPFMLHEAWQNRDQILAVLQYAWNNPGEFLSELGKALIDLDTLVEDGVARWLGKRVPDIVLALATAGLGTVGTGAALSVRGARGGRAATALARTLRVTDRLDGLTTIDGAADAAGLLGRGRVMNQLNRLGADATRLERLSDAGAFARADTGLGRLATRLDEFPIVERMRQAPGVLNDEIKAVTSMPHRFLKDRFQGSFLVEHVTPGMQRKIDSVITNGWTGRLGMIDGLLVGGPALSPQTRAAMVTVLGVSVADTVTGPFQIFDELATAAGAPRKP